MIKTAKLDDASRGTWRRFGSASGGNTAVTFALAFIPIVGLVGMAIDYSRASAARSTMQAAADATALMIAQNAASSSPAALSQSANDYFFSIFKRKDAQNVAVTATYDTTNGPTVFIKATATYKPIIMNVLNVGPFPLNANSTASWGNTRLRVALVLDNTGSMAQANKLPTLQSALTNTSSTTPGLLAQLKKAASTPSDVYVSIIPFVKDTNVGNGNNTQAWMDFTDWGAEPNNLNTNLTGGAKPTGTPTDPKYWYKVKASSTCPFPAKGNSNYMGFVCTNGPGSLGGSNASSIPNSGNYNGLICPGLDDGTKNPMHQGSYYNGCYNSWQTCTGPKCACSTTDTTICKCSGSGSSTTCTTQTYGAGQQYWEHTWRPDVPPNATYMPTPPNSPPPPNQPNYATPATSTWNGCVTDRGTPVPYPSSTPVYPPVGPPSPPGTAAGNDENVTAPVAGVVTTQYPAEQYSMCPSAKAMGLNYDWSSMTTLVNSMTANGNTNQAIGFQLGWMSLVGGGPFTMPAEDSNYAYRHYIILLTDGFNTQNCWYGTGNNCSKGNTNLTGNPLMCMDQRQAQLCDNFKAQNPDPTKPTWTIYAIQVNTDGEATSNLLQYCAGSTPKQGDPKKFYILTSANQITATFNQIASEISRLHIAK